MEIATNTTAINNSSIVIKEEINTKIEDVEFAYYIAVILP